MRLKNWHLTFRRWLHEELQNQLRRFKTYCLDAPLMKFKIKQDGIERNLGYSLLNRHTNTYVAMSLG